MHTAFFVAGVVGRCRHQLEARGAVGDLFEQPFCISKDCCGTPQNCKILSRFTPFCKGKLSLTRKNVSSLMVCIIMCCELFLRKMHFFLC